MIAAALALAVAAASADSNRVVDPFDSVSQWKVTPADGVEMTIHSDSGRHGRGARLDFDFHGHGGYAVIHRVVSLDLPANYEFSFSVRGPAPTNTLEFKLIDSSGENVWWSNNPDFTFPREWRTVTRKARQIVFAWGPSGGAGGMHHVGAIEFAITAGSGGKGSVWLDDLVLTPLPPETRDHPTPRAAQTANSYSLDFLERREFSGLVIDWLGEHRPMRFTVLGSKDSVVWDTLAAVRRNGSPPRSGLRDFLFLPESDARYLNIVYDGETSAPARVRGVTVEPLEWAQSANDFLRAVAADAPRGSYPKYWSGEQSYWTVVGADRDTAEGLINEQGMVETGRGRFSIEPFLYSGGKLITWNDARTSVLPDAESLPLPRVQWNAGDLGLTISAFAAEHPDPSVLFARYRVANNSATRRKITLYLAIRPYQVNPPWQFLNLAGGVARIDSISLDKGTAPVNGNLSVRSLSTPSGSGAATFDDGNIVEWMRAGKLPSANSVADRTGHASAAFAYELDLPPHSSSAWIDVAIPLHPGDSGAVRESVAAQLTKTRAAWREKLGRVTIQLPPSAAIYTRTMRANLAYILINRDGPAIQPGSRSYSRSWIRDGALTATALLRLGHSADVRDFIEWYAPYQYANGKIPCCVDEHGATPVPENDADGEFIYLVAEYYRHTGDRVLLSNMWPHVALAAAHLDSLRALTMTSDFRAPAKRAFYGLLPESISHEGYSAKPMHSYWDDLFALRGYKDAAFIAGELGKPEARALAATRDAFRADLYASMRPAMQQHHIDFIPGSAELGDFDATSTTIAVSPVGELGTLPEPALRNTFEKYFRNFLARRDGSLASDAYTPYELRAVGTMVQLGYRDRAHEMLDFFFKDQRPPAWHMWAEVVWKNPKTPKFIGDLPHTWVGSDYIRSFLDFFAYERESDSSLVLGAGVTRDWLRESPGVRVANLSTEYGLLTYAMRERESTLTISIESGLRLPPGGIVVRPPDPTRIVSASVNGIRTVVKNSEVKVSSLPARVVIRYAR